MACGRHLVDEVDRLAAPHGFGGQVASCHALLVGLLSSGVSRKLVFPPPPLVEEGVPEGASRILRWPRRSPSYVGDAAALGVLPASLDDRLSDRGGNQRFEGD